MDDLHGDPIAGAGWVLNTPSRLRQFGSQSNLGLRLILFSIINKRFKADRRACISNNKLESKYMWGFFRLASIVFAIIQMTPMGHAQAANPAVTCSNAPAGSTASIVQTTGESPQRKRWQPQGGVMQFTARSFAAIPADSSFLVCFRWKTTDEDNNGEYSEIRPDRFDRSSDGTTWTITATIPHKFNTITKGKTADWAIPLVYLADVRILALKADKSLAAEASTVIGITYPVLAIIYAVATIVFALAVLSAVGKQYLKAPELQNAPWPLRIISTPTGHASLSQLQITLWTILVAASAVYVMALSGELIAITDGTLVLLGIAGAAALGSKVHDKSQAATIQAAVATSQREADKAKADATLAPTQAQKDVADKVAQQADAKAARAQDNAQKLISPVVPNWYDLLINETTRDGVTVQEIDVTRFQLLLFTLITAAFVLMNVVTTYAIPEIPTGFLTLMGISNGVYLGAKVAQS